MAGFLDFKAEHEERDRRLASQQRHQNEFLSNFKSISSTPPLWRMNGCGVALYGWLHDSRLGHPFIKLYFISILWIPIVPIGTYVVSSDGDAYRFSASIGLWRPIRLYRLRVLALYATALIEGAAWLAIAFCVLGAVYGAIHWIRS